MPRDSPCMDSIQVMTSPFSRAVHSRFSMDKEKMTARVLRAMDDPHLTILAHPTGRLLLSRAGYELDMEAVIEKAASLLPDCTIGIPAATSGGGPISV